MDTNRLLFIGLCWLLMACQASEYQVNVAFDEVQGLTVNDALVFKGHAIGKVTRIRYTENADFVVTLAVREEFENAVTNQSRFYIQRDPTDPGKRTIEMIHLKSDGSPLASQSTVKGSSKTAVLVDQWWRHLAEGVETAEGEFKKLLAYLQNLSDSEALKSLADHMETIAKELVHTSEAVQKKIKEEIIPRIQEELDRLKLELEKQGRGDELVPLEKRLEEIKKT